MRSVDKGPSPATYIAYGDAQFDLIQRLGPYCSYCEMEISNEPDVEHVEPKSRGGALLDWNNFLLGCKKCNKIKGKKNPNRNNHLWPDEDNTSVAFEYYNEIFVRPSPFLNPSSNEFQYAESILKLTGIDRVPFNQALTKKIKKDRRWQKRKIAWERADIARKRWRRNSSPEVAEQIADTAQAIGFYSIWIKFFSEAGELPVLQEIKSRFPNTYEPMPDPAGGFIVRPGGRF